MPKRAYTTAEVCALLQLSRAAFYARKHRGILPPCIEELKPRIGPRTIRYRADLLDRYLENRRRFGR